MRVLHGEVANAAVGCFVVLNDESTELIVIPVVDALGDLGLEERSHAQIKYHIVECSRIERSVREGPVDERGLGTEFLDTLLNPGAGSGCSMQGELAYWEVDAPVTEARFEFIPVDYRGAWERIEKGCRTRRLSCG